MALKSKPYRVSWDGQAGSLEEINKRLAHQLMHINTMLEDIYANAPAETVNDADGTDTDTTLEVETGSWTPDDNSGADLVFTNTDGEYFKIGSLVILFGALTYPATASALPAFVAGFPFAPVSQSGQPLRWGGAVISSSEATAVKLWLPAVSENGVQFLTAADAIITNATLTTNYINFFVIYRTDE